jgi:hypothetical protein
MRPRTFLHRVVCVAARHVPAEEMKKQHSVLEVRGRTLQFMQYFDIIKGSRAENGAAAE